VIVNDVPSNERTATLPEDGLGRIEYQPDPVAGQMSYISSAGDVAAGATGVAYLGRQYVPPEPAYVTGDVVAHAGSWWIAVENDPQGEPGVDEAWAEVDDYVWGDFPPANGYFPDDIVVHEESVWVALLENPGGYEGTAPGTDPEVWEEIFPDAWADPGEPVGEETLLRALVEFHDVPPTVTIDSATMSLWRPSPLSGGQTTVDVHELTSDWEEDTATWAESRPGFVWENEDGGGDFDPDPIDTVDVPAPGNAGAGWDQYDVTDLVQVWSDGERPNNGVVLKLADEATTNVQWQYYADDWTTAPTLRPKLTVLYEDGSEARKPEGVAISAPAAGMLLEGSQTIEATATDDSGVAEVEFFRGTTSLGTDTSAPYSMTWNTATVANGEYALKVVATDRAGLSAESEPITVSVGNSDPPETNVNIALDTTYAGQVIADLPAGYWRLDDEESATVAEDSSGHGLDGTFADAAVQGERPGATPDGNWAARFLSASDAIEVDDGGDLAFEDEPFTLEANLWTLAEGNQTVAAKRGLWKVEITDDSGHDGELKISLAHPTQANTYRTFYGPVLRASGQGYEPGDRVLWEGSIWTAMVATLDKPGAGSDWTGGVYQGQWIEDESEALAGEYWLGLDEETLYVALDDTNYIPGSIMGDCCWEEVSPFPDEWVPTGAQFRHLVVVVDGPTPVAYVDGEPQTLTQADTSGSTAQVEPFQIGGFDGGLDEVAIYPTALAPARVAAHFSALSASGSAVAYSSDDDPNNGGPLIGNAIVSADATDDEGVVKVEFLADGEPFAEDTTAPYETHLNTLDPNNPLWDGGHTISARAHDADGNQTTSPGVDINVTNSAATPYEGTPEPQTEIPPTFEYDPEAAPEEQATTPVEVDVENRSGEPWANVRTAYRWFESGTENVVATGPLLQLGTPVGDVYTLTIDVAPAPPPSGATSASYDLRFDLYDLATQKWFSAWSTSSTRRPATRFSTGRPSSRRAAGSPRS
jgi:hypothetical protein